LAEDDSSIQRRHRAPPKLISVVMPVRDAARTVLCQLDALANQDYEGASELLVVDTGSRDGTAGLVARRLRMFSAGRLLRMDGRPRNPASCARNAGAVAGTGDLLAFCDADDVASPGWLTALARGARNTDIVAGCLDVVTLNSSRVRSWHDRRGGLRPTLHFLPRVSTAGCAVWRDVFDAVGGFDEDHPGAEDTDFAWRAQLAGYQVGAASAAVMAYRYRFGLRAIAHQQFRWGKADARLYRDYGAAGMERVRFAEAGLAWTEILFAAPIHFLSQTRRGRWTLRSARRVGRLVGSVQERKLFL
jgi:glycosyltransferase involved in cell wall biosynthesis